MPARKVLYLDHAPFLGGAQIVLLNLLRALQTDEWTPIVATSARSPLRGALEGSGIAAHSVPFDRLKQAGPALPVHWLWAGISVARLARQEKVDVLHSNTVRAHLVGSLAA